MQSACHIPIGIARRVQGAVTVISRVRQPRATMMKGEQPNLLTAIIIYPCDACCTSPAPTLCPYIISYRRIITAHHGRRGRLAAVTNTLACCFHVP